MSIASQGAELTRFACAVAPLRSGLARVGDFVALMKPRVMSLVVFTALCGLVVAPGPHDPIGSLVALLCISTGAGAAGALNMWYDADVDAVMSRAAMRPIPRGRVLRPEALAFGFTLAAGSVLFMSFAVNVAAAALLAFTIFFSSSSIPFGSSAGPLRTSSWRRCRRISSGDRLGCDDRQRGDRAGHPVPHHLPLDAASLLGAIAQTRS